jgi:uncharacterized glyoxalase superfamily protein PhnB
VRIRRRSRGSASHPQLFVADVTRAADFYKRKLGFSIIYLDGKPPLYGLVSRDGAGLKHVDAPVMDPSRKDPDVLLSANSPVEGVEELFRQFQRAGVAFAQTLKSQPWGTTDFIVRDLEAI